MKTYTEQELSPFIDIMRDCGIPTKHLTWSGLENIANAMQKQSDNILKSSNSFELGKITKHVDEYYKDWCGKTQIENDVKLVHDSSDAIDFAEYYHNQKFII